MEKILFYAGNVNYESYFDVDERDACNDGFICLKERLYELGYLLTPYSQIDAPIEEYSHIIFLGTGSVYPLGGGTIVGTFKKFIKYCLPSRYKRYNLYKNCLKKGLRSKLLFIWGEGSVVDVYFNHDDIKNKFNCILTWKNNYLDNIKFFKYYLPISRSYPLIPKLKFNDKKLILNISMNKSSKSKYELYSKRRDSIRYFEKYHPSDFDLYGYGWDKNEFPSYKGMVKNKVDVLPFYKFCLCYENNMGEDDYITEKIFDAMRSNTVPIYWGAPNIDSYVDPGAFIDRRKFNSDKELAEYICSMTEDMYIKIILNIENYLQSDSFKLFSAVNYSDTIIKALNISKSYSKDLD